MMKNSKLSQNHLQQLGLNILYYGEFNGNNGPGIVDQSLLKCLNNIRTVTVPRNLKFPIFVKSLIKSLPSCSIIHVSGVSFKGLILMLIAPFFGKKTTCTFHGALNIERDFRSIPILLPLIEKMQVMLAQKCICVSKQLAADLSQDYKSIHVKAEIIYNGYSTSKITCSKRIPFSILSIGGGRPEKNILSLCKAIELVSSDSVKWKLYVCGNDGRDTEAIKKYNFVEYLGTVSHAHIYKLISECSLFAQISSYEPFGMTILEALSLGTPVLVSNKVGALEILPLDSILICKYNDIDSIAAGIEKSMHTNFSRSADLSAYNWNQVASNYIRLWKDMTSSTKLRPR